MKCLACNKDHAWALVSSKYEDICGPCSEEDSRVKYSNQEGKYVIFGYCSCGAFGAVNYGRDDTDYQYFCGGPHGGCRP